MVPAKSVILCTICLLEPKRYLSSFTSQSQYKFLLGAVPQFWEKGGGVDLAGRVWYPLKVLHMMYNVFAVTEMLSLFVYEPIAKQIMVGRTVPQFGGEGVELGGRVWYSVKTHHTGHNLLIRTDTLALFV